MNILGFGKQQLPSVVKDPFGKSKITEVYVRFWDMWGRGEWTAHGVVYFKNGDTKGEQRFEGKTFDEVVSKIKAMIETI